MLNGTAGRSSARRRSEQIPSSDLLVMRRNRFRVVKEFEAAAIVASCLSGMRPPWRWMEQFYLLSHQQGAEFRGEAFDEIFVRVHAGPMRSPVGIVIEFPEVYKLIDCARVALEISDELLVLPALLEPGKPIS